MSNIKTNSIEAFSESTLIINTKTNISSIEDSTSSNTGSLTIDGGLGINKNLQIDGVINSNLTTNSTDKDTGAIIIKGGIGIEKNIYLGGELISENFINTYKSSRNISLVQTTNTAVTGNFTDSDILYLYLNGSSSATTITFSVENPTPNKMRELQLFVRSNGNYTFASGTVQGLPLVWKTTTNASGTQPTWSTFNTLTDFHTFMHDGARLFHVQTFSYHTPTVTPPTNFSYQTNTFDLYPYISYTITPTISGTPPFSFTNPTSDLPTGIKLNSFSGNLNIYRTETLNTSTPTIRATNPNNFINRQVNFRFSHALGTITKGSSGNSAGYDNITITGSDTVSFGTISSDSFYSNMVTSIKQLKWEYISSGSRFGYWFYFDLNGNMTGINWSTIEIGGGVFILKSETNAGLINGTYNTSSNTTSWTWWSTYNSSSMNITKYNTLQTYSNPISFRIY